MGIVPHLVMLTDAGDHLYDQLCKKIPQSAKNCVLVPAFHCSPKILKAWHRQGRRICFYAGRLKKPSPILTKTFSADKLERISVAHGGNVANMSFLITLSIVGSTVFMAVGNDLSFPYEQDKDTRESIYYAAGDYNDTVKKEGLDEAKDKFVWAGFEFVKSPFSADSRPQIDLKKAMTTRQFFVYKVWLESTLATFEQTIKGSFRYLNCSEGGIIGVLANDTSWEACSDINNYSLLDTVCPKKYGTRTLDSAASEFLRARSRTWHGQAGTRNGVRGVVHLPPGMDGVRIAAP